MKPTSRLRIKGPDVNAGQGFLDRSLARSPAPDLETSKPDLPRLVFDADEVVKILGLDKGKKDPVKGGRQALRVLVRRTGIRPSRIGYSYKYTRKDILSLIEAAKRQ
jgi:hypothetical protein